MFGNLIQWAADVLNSFGSLGLVLLLPENLDHAEEWFERNSNAVVLFARMVPGARSVVSVPASMLYMPIGQFTLLTAAG